MGLVVAFGAQEELHGKDSALALPIRKVKLRRELIDDAGDGMACLYLTVDALVWPFERGRV